MASAEAAAVGGSRQTFRLPKIEAYYFLQFSSIACITPYFNLLFRRSGLSEAQIGTIAALRPWMSFPASFAWAAVADTFAAHRLLFIVLFVAGNASRSLVAFPLPGPFWGILISMLMYEAMSANGVLADAAVVASLPDSRTYGKLRMWGAVGWGIFALVGGWIINRFGVSTAWTMFWVGSGVTLVVAAWGIPFEAVATKKALAQEDSSVKSDQRVVGKAPVAADDDASFLSVELAEMSGTATQLRTGTAQHTSTLPTPARKSIERAEKSDASEAELCAVVESGCENGPATAAKGGSAAEAAHTEETDHLLYEDYTEGGDCGRGQGVEPRPGMRALLSLASSVPVALFLLLVTVMGTAVGVIEGYLFLYIEELGGTETLMGLTLTFTCISETPIFFFSEAILNKLGTEGTLNLVLSAFLVRLVAYSTMEFWPSPWMILPVELLHGITFGCAWAAGTHKCAQLAPEGLGASMQSLFQGCYFGLGRGIGALVGGLFYEKFGAGWMYRAAFIWVSTGWIVQSLLRRAILPSDRPESIDLVPHQLQRMEAGRSSPTATFSEALDTSQQADHGV